MQALKAAVGQNSANVWTKNMSQQSGGKKKKKQNEREQGEGRGECVWSVEMF